MNVDLLERQLAHCTFGHTVYYYSNCSSTQNLVHTLARTHRSGTLVTAAEQSAGRGRHGRHWYARRHSSITASFLLKQPLWLAPRPAQALLAGMAVRDAVAQQVPHLDDALYLKWPNDVVVRTADGQLAKLAGILVEGRMTPAGSGHAVLGIGINVNQLPAELPRVAAPALAAISLRALTDRTHDRAHLLIALCRALARYLHQDAAVHARARIWDTRLITLGATVTVRTGAAGPPLWQGQAVATTDSGSLIVRNAAGQTRTVDAADVTLQDGYSPSSKRGFG